MTIAFAEGSDRLPPGRHVVTVEDIERVLVDGFAVSGTRRPLFERWKQVLAAIESLVPVEMQWIDGSFVTTKLDPGDIDVVSHLDGEAMDALDPVQQTLLAGLIAGHPSRDIHACDSFWVPVYPEGHPAREESERAALWWNDFFGKDRDGESKGYVELRRNG